MFSAFSVAQGYLTHHPHNTMCFGFHVITSEELNKEKYDGPIFNASVVT